MKKPNITILQFEDFEEPEHDYAYLLFLTDIPCFAFIDELNHLYNLSLTRMNDLTLYGALWPFYYYHDTMSHLRYFFIERPNSSNNNASGWSPGHKLLIIKGEDAIREIGSIYDDFTTPPAPPDPLDRLAMQRHQQLLTLYESFIPVSLLNLDSPTPLARKAAKEFTELQHLIYSLTDQFDINMLQ